MNTADKTINDFIKDLSSSSHAPGGGSVAYLSATFATSLTLMVCQISRKKPEFNIFIEQNNIINQLNELRNYFSFGTDRDIKIFDNIMSSIKSKNYSEKVYIDACEESISVLNHLSILSKINSRIFYQCSKSLISDIKASKAQVIACVKIIQYNFESNVKSIKDLSIRNNLLKDFTNETNSLLEYLEICFD